MPQSCPRDSASKFREIHPGRFFRDAAGPGFRGRKPAGTLTTPQGRLSRCRPPEWPAKRRDPVACAGRGSPDAAPPDDATGRETGSPGPTSFVPCRRIGRSGSVGQRGEGKGGIGSCSPSASDPVGRPFGSRSRIMGGGSRTAGLADQMNRRGRARAPSKRNRPALGCPEAGRSRFPGSRKLGRVRARSGRSWPRAARATRRGCSDRSRSWRTRADSAGAAARSCPQG